MSLTCSLMLLMPSGPSRLTACFTRSVRPQLSMRKPRSCRNFASVEAASSFLEAQKQSSVLKGEAHKSDSQHKARAFFWLFAMHHIVPEHLTSFIFQHYREMSAQENVSITSCSYHWRASLCGCSHVCLLVFYSCAYEEVACTASKACTLARSRTEADEARSPLRAAAAWQPAGHHRCPQRSCVCAPCGPQPHEPTPSEAAAPRTACRGR